VIAAQARATGLFLGAAWESCELVVLDMKRGIRWMLVRAKGLRPVMMGERCCIDSAGDDEGCIVVVVLVVNGFVVEAAKR